MLKKMHIGIIGTRGIPNHYGGFEQFAGQLSTGLVQRGHAVSVYNSSNHPYQHKEWNGVTIIHCKDPEPKLGTFGQFLYDRNCLLDSYKRGFDILLHLGYTSDVVWWRLWKKDAIHIMNMDGLEWKREKYNVVTKQYLKWAEKKAAQYSDILIADSVGIQQYISAKYKKKPVFIPYSATPFSSPNPELLNPLQVNPYKYCLLIARMEPENNIEMVIQGFISSGSEFPLLIVGSTSGKYGSYIQKKYKGLKVLFVGGIYDTELLNNLRFYSRYYFHGHSVGGTNPSLLEAMACSCTIVAHNNIFNKGVLEENADYFSTADDVAEIINSEQKPESERMRKEMNLKKITTQYGPDKIVNDYEALMLSALAAKETKVSGD